MQYWQTITALIGLVFAGGIFYAKVQAMQQQIDGLEDRATRQYEQINKQDERIDQLEKDAYYQKGLHDAPNQYEADKKTK